MEGEDFSLSETPPHCIFAGTTAHLHTPGHNVLRHSIVAVQVIKKCTIIIPCTVVMPFCSL